MRRGGAAAPRKLSHAQPKKKKKGADPARGAGSGRPGPPRESPPLVTAPSSEPSQLSEAAAQTGVLFRKMKNTPFR